jgi:predicted MPP superfamily phosphohydrolase
MTAVNRRRFLQGAAGFIGGGLALGGYSTIVEAGLRLELTPYDISPPAWPDDLTLNVAIIADIHACEPWMSAERVASIVDLANAQKPDLILLLGDFVANHRFVAGYVPPGAWAAELARLEAPLGVYSVLGNHDWWTAAIPSDPPDNGQSIRRALADARIPVLENQALRLWQNGKPFWLIGLADQLAFRHGRHEAHGADDLAGSLRDLNDNAPAILIAHEPYIFPRVPDRVALTLCGHTHGGQIYLPFIGAPFAPRAHRKYIYGCYREGPRQLVVSGGLGESFAPVRFLRPPEVVTIAISGGTRQSV